jgi:hypothetical protein
MVIGEKHQNCSSVTDDADVEEEQQQQQQRSKGMNQATIDNIMSGIENTGAVKMNNHRKKLRQRYDSLTYSFRYGIIHKH